ncbi:MAG: hypothetical protein QG575_1047, partial [Euryarchaeota archaeon]|nr:hypothetical protein [Euryarchaeota archaeon]
MRMNLFKGYVGLHGLFSQFQLGRFAGIVPPKALISPPPFHLTMNFARLFKSKPSPRIASSPPFNYLDLRSKPFYIVASVEVGNTTTKCVLTATDMNTGKTYIVNKTVKMTR